MSPSPEGFIGQCDQPGSDGPRTVSPRSAVRGYLQASPEDRDASRVLSTRRVTRTGPGTPLRAVARSPSWLRPCPGPRSRLDQASRRAFGHPAGALSGPGARPSPGPWRRSLHAPGRDAARPWSRAMSDRATPRPSRRPTQTNPLDFVATLVLNCRPCPERRSHCTHHSRTPRTCQRTDTGIHNTKQAAGGLPGIDLPARSVRQGGGDGRLLMGWYPGPWCCRISAGKEP